MPAIDNNRLETWGNPENTVKDVYHLPFAREGGLGGFVYLFFKRAFDIVFSLVGLLLFSPLLAIAAVAIKLDSRGPVFYSHSRLGKNGVPLTLYKLRTMAANADELFREFTPGQKREFEENYKLSNDPRITRLGGFLRRSSLDELPQLLNILQGNLSFVGPRPLVENEIEKYGAHKHRFLSVKPGLTGYWQVNGRNNTTYRERMALELHYVDNASFWLDMRVLLKTAPTVIRKIGSR